MYKPARRTGIFPNLSNTGITTMSTTLNTTAVGKDDPFSEDGIDIYETTRKFNDGAEDLNLKVQTLLQEVIDDPSSSGNLALYQSALSAYTLYRSAQTNTAKAEKEVSAGTIRNFN
jgi:type III secretion protein F